ncbi:MAG: FAD-dependent oxidoreductase [Longicatena sp.]
MNNYPNLFSPIKIGETTVKNRIFMPPVSTNLADKGYITDTLIEHYSARAKGGVGLIITEVTTIEPVYTYLPGDISIADDSYIPGWKKLADSVHQYGSKIIPQLFHPAYMAFPIPGTPRLIAPSNIGPSYAKEAPRPATIPELKKIIKQFGEAALRVQIAQGDGVEIHAAHAHGLLGGFLSPTFNKRSDEYGGDINGRLKLVLEVLDEVRRVCGKNFIIEVRISGDEYSDGGLNLNDAIYVAKQLEKHGADMLHVSGGATIKRASSIPAPGTKQGAHIASSEEIKKYVSIPVATVGRIIEPWIAEEIIANGKADIVMMGRANLCDSEFVNKAQNGNEIDIRPCIGCLRCLNGIMFGKRVSCSINPSLEIENEETIQVADKKKNILVIGGGPAGMEAAYVAKKRGHHVVLCEHKDELGGLMRLACVPIAKQDIAKVTKYMSHKLAMTGVDIRLNCTLTKDTIAQEFSDYEIIMSNGAKPIIVKSFTNFKQCVSADDILAGIAFPGRKIVIIGGGSVGCETADYLAPLVYDQYPRDREIILIEMTKSLMATESGPGRSLLMQRLMSKGVQINCNAKVQRVEEDKIYYEKDGKTTCIDDADTLVLAMGYRSDTTLSDTLKELAIPYHTIGDCEHIGNLKDAIHAGYDLAKDL